MSKTVAIVSNTSWFIYNFHKALLQRLLEDGYKVIAVAPLDEYSQKLEALGIEYYEVKINSKGTSPVEDAKLIYDFYKLYKKIAPDVVLQYTIKPNIYGSIAAGMLKIPVISSITGLGTVFLNDSFSSKVAKMLYRIALRSARKVFFLNSYDRELFVKSKLVKSEKAELIPGSGIDTEIFKPLEERSSEGNVFRFLFIARLLKDKGLVEYVEAAKKIIRHSALNIQHDKMEFCILGAYYHGNPTAITEEDMKSWEDEGFVKYLGVSDDVPSVIADAGCIVLPSYREGLSQVLLEAASMAKPIVTTNVPGCKEVVDDGVNGYLCEVRDANDLSKQIEKILLLSPEERVMMGQKGREKVMHEFDEKIVNKKYLDAIASILDE